MFKESLSVIVLNRRANMQIITYLKKMILRRDSFLTTYFVDLFGMKEKPNHILVSKSNGDLVPFDKDKIISALKYSGAGLEESYQILEQIESKLYDKIPTSKIYQWAYSLLKKKKSHKAAGRYRLKKAIFELGPSGYAFELFVSRLFESWGHQVKTDQLIKGKCILHEVDVLANKEDLITLVECKFRSDYRGKTDVKVPLYIHSRFNDIMAKWSDDPNYKNIKVKGFVVTNARFTKDAIEFAECAGLGLISWDYPYQSSLKYYIDKSGMHPLTSLHNLTKAQKSNLLKEGIVLCRELVKSESTLRSLGMSDKQIAKVISEARLLSKE